MAAFQPSKRKRSVVRPMAPIEEEEAGAPSKKVRQEPLVFFSRSKDPLARSLSNSAPSWIQLEGCSEWYPTVEHAYQVCKSNDPAYTSRFYVPSVADVPLVGMDARKARAFGCKASFKRLGLTAELDEVHLGFQMVKALEAKFDPNLDDNFFARALDSTGDRPLHHLEPVPGRWGCHTDAATGAIKRGQNELGFILEEIRTDNRPILAFHAEAEAIRAASASASAM